MEEVTPEVPCEDGQLIVTKWYADNSVILVSNFVGIVTVTCVINGRRLERLEIVA